jgi:hypothetical protein
MENLGRGKIRRMNTTGKIKEGKTELWTRAVFMLGLIIRVYIMLNTDCP